MGKIAVIFTIAASLFSMTNSVFAKADYFDRIARARALVADHDKRTAEDIYEGLRQSESAEANLRIYEAVAQTYRDLLEGGKFTRPGQKAKLYDQIRMNVAFIQFGGDPAAKDKNKINMWIRQTLMKYLSEDLIGNDQVFYSTDDWK